jgi:hypothetical protein
MPGSDGQLRGAVRAFLRGQRFEPHCHAWMTEFDKDLGTRFELKVIDVARELVDTEPALDSPDTLSRLLAEAVLHGPEGTLRGGTTEILRGIVARQLVAP